jgi:hypothetical protein
VSNSDNLLLIHLDPTHTHAIVLSIPRDTFVYEPACKERAYIGTGTWPAQQYPPGAIIDGALNIGGPTCAVQTVEALTGVKLDHFVEFNQLRRRMVASSAVSSVRSAGSATAGPRTWASAPASTCSITQALQLRSGTASAALRTCGGDLPIGLQQAFRSVVQRSTPPGCFQGIPAR